MKFSAKSPTRVDLAGGTLDCWPLFLLVNESQTINLAIDIFTYADLEVNESLAVEINLSDVNYKRSFKDIQAAMECTDPQMEMLRYHFEYWKPQQGFKLTTKSESPVGGGLGGSSSLTISLLKVFCAWFGESWSTTEMVNVAHNLEAKILRKPTGTQDYIPAIQPGLNVIHYGLKGPEPKLVDFPLEYFRDRMFLVYTGQPHHSGLNNWQVIKAAINGDQQTLKHLHGLKKVAADTARVVQKGQWESLPRLFLEEFNSRVGLAEAFSSPKIEALRELVLKHGGSAVKICGAGGGGCVMVWSEPERRTRIVEACQKDGFQVLLVQPVAGA